MAIEVIEVIRRTEQGITRPYVCKAANGELYFVKGKGAGYVSLAREWLAGSLAVAFGLPVPPFTVLNVASELYEVGRNGGLSDLGFGPVFGSKAIPMANELSFTEAESIDAAMRRDIAVFDWWIMNGDRTLSDQGGNPNILWSTKVQGPHIIDHNLAFDDGVTLSSLEDGHVFGRDLSDVVNAPRLQGMMSDRIGACLEGWDEICGEMPERWRFLDDMCSVETGFSDQQALAVLRRFETKEFWKRT